MGRFTSSVDSQVVIFNQTYPRLQTALLDGSIPDALHHWNTLSREGLLGYLGPSHYEPISRLLAKLLSRRGQEGAWAETVLETVETMALAAVAYAPDSLLACMMYYIRSKNGPAALALYNRYLVSDAFAAWREADGQLAGSVDTNELATIRDEQQAAVMPGRTDLHLAAIAAYALDDRFHEGMTMCLQSDIRLLRLSAAESFANTHFANDKPFADKVEAYIRTFDRARLAFRPALMIKHIENLTADNNITGLEKLYTSLIDGFSGPHGWLAADPAAVSNTRPVLMTESIWASFIFAFIHCGRSGAVEKLWDDMHTYGATPGAGAWTALIDAYGTLGEATKSKSYFDAMKSQGILPAAPTYRAIIHALFTNSRQEEAMYCFADYKKVASSFAEEDQVAVLNAVLNGLLAWKPSSKADVSKDRDGRAAEAHALFESMRTSGPKPDIISYNTMLAYYSRRADLASLAKILGELTQDGATGDVFTFSIILSAMLKAGRKDAQEIMLNTMRKHGVRPNVATYTGIMTHQIRHGTEENVHEALRMLQRMEVDADKYMQPNQVTYASIISAISHNSSLSADLIDEYTQHILQRMALRNVRPTRSTYHHLISASLDNPSPKGIQRALGLYREMAGRKMHFIYNSWYIIISGLYKRQEWELAKVIVGDMLRSGFRPHGSLQDMVTRIMRNH
jgi:pentatricopeptide repeat protein